MLSPWTDPLIVVLALALTFSLAWFWVGIFYIDQPYNNIISFDAADRPNTALTETFVKPLIGVHYFGDFQEPLAWLRGLIESGTSPYSEGVIYLPLSFLVLTPLAVLPPAAGLVLYTMFVAALVIAGLWVLLKHVRPSLRVSLIFFTTIATTPTIAILDRGNLQGLVLAGLVWCLVAIRYKNMPILESILVILICLKGYPVLLLVPLLAFSRFAALARILVATIALNILLFALLPGGLATNLNLYTDSLLGYSDNGIWPSNYSLVAAFHQLSQLVLPDNTFFVSGGLVAYLPGVFWLTLVFVGIKWFWLPAWAWIFLTLASLQLAVPVSYAYVASWASVAAFAFCLQHFSSSAGRLKNESSSDVLVRVIVILSLTATLTPFAFRFFSLNDQVVSLMPLLSSTVTTLAGIIIFCTYARRRFQPPTEPSESRPGNAFVSDGSQELIRGPLEARSS